MLTDTWQRMKLADVAESISAGGTPRRNVKEYWETGDIPWLKISDLKSTYVSDSEEKITKEGLQNSSAKLFSKGTVLFSIFATLGATAILSKPSTTNQAIAGIVPKKEIIDTKFLYYLLKAERAKIIAKKTHATQDNINLSILRNHEISVPSLETQVRIVSVLEKAEQLREWRKQSDLLTVDYLNSVFFHIFGNPVTNDKKWKLRKLESFGRIITGNTPLRARQEYYGNFIEWIKSDNVNTPDIFLTTSKEMLSKEGAKYGRIVPPRSVLVTCIAGSVSCIGNVAISKNEVAFNQQINAIVPNAETDAFFLYFLILNSKKYIQNHSSKALKGIITKKAFGSLEFIAPPSDLQKKFGIIVKKVIVLQESQRISRQHIESFFKNIEQIVIRG